MVKPVARLYPNGEFGIGFIREKKLEELLSTLGSSNASISHKAKRGSGGISPYARRMVRNACFLLEQRYGNKNLSFATVTLPSLSESDGKRVMENWSEILRVFFQRFKRYLKSGGLLGSVVGVVEIQMKRLRKDSTILPLHVHFVFNGRKPGSGWACSPARLRMLWHDSLSPYLCDSGQGSSYDWSACENLQQVKESASAYLGKYLSKGAGDLEEVSLMGLGDSLPSSWWVCSLGLKAAVKNRVKYGSELAERLIDAYKESPHLFRYWKEIKIESRGEEYRVGICGQVDYRKWLGYSKFGFSFLTDDWADD